MKKLIAITLILALLLPAFALAEDDLFVAYHYSMYIDGKSPSARSAVGERYFSQDSITYDLYVMSDGKTGYFVKTECVSGIFLSSGFVKVKIVEIDGRLRIVDDTGNNLNAKYGETEEDFWLDIGIGYCRMHLVKPFKTYTDQK